MKFCGIEDDIIAASLELSRLYRGITIKISLFREDTRKKEAEGRNDRRIF